MFHPTTIFRILFFFPVLAFVLGACSPGPQPPAASDPIAEFLAASPSPPDAVGELARLGYAVQVGAFAEIENAVRLEQRLQKRGIDAYQFRHRSGLFKVRFGNHPTYRAAREEARELQARGLIEAFFIVTPESYAARRTGPADRGPLRAELVATARRFLGVPYRWGGTDADGFDCSGLTMVCYRLNGLDLPRVSRSQYRAGRSVSRERLRPGDLVFFATGGGQRVTHVGLYIGRGRFIHAPRRGKTVRVAELATPFFERTFVGARSYL